MQTVAAPDASADDPQQDETKAVGGWDARDIDFLDGERWGRR